MIVWSIVSNEAFRHEIKTRHKFAWKGITCKKKFDFFSELSKDPWLYLFTKHSRSDFHRSAETRKPTLNNCLSTRIYFLNTFIVKVSPRLIKGSRTLIFLGALKIMIFVNFVNSIDVVEDTFDVCTYSYWHRGYISFYVKIDFSKLFGNKEAV